jgi:DNA-binding helix-turn-helix protein
MKISEIVATQRRRLGLKQYQLAEKTGIAPSQISIFERGSSGMVTTNLEKVLVALGLHIVYDRQSVQQHTARTCAHALLANGIHDLRSITREEIAAIMNNDDLLLLPVVSEELYRRYCRSEVVDETNTWNHFIKLVHNYILEEMDGVYDPERAIPAQEM